MEIVSYGAYKWQYEQHLNYKAEELLSELVYCAADSGKDSVEYPTEIIVRSLARGTWVVVTHCPFCGATGDDNSGSGEW